MLDLECSALTLITGYDRISNFSAFQIKAGVRAPCPVYLQATRKWFSRERGEVERLSLLGL